MNIKIYLRKIAKNYSTRARTKRAKLFRNYFKIDKNTKILDLGSEDGSNIFSVLSDADITPSNIYIADIKLSLIQKGNKKYGFTPILLNESEPIPFNDGYFDIVYSSSVIEHVTINKNLTWNTYSGKEFKQKSLKRQLKFSKEIKRLGKQYFVQTPYKYFPIESHTWLPLLGYMPRRLLIPILRITNSIWIKKTSPDWNLLNKKNMLKFFPDGKIVNEKLFGLTKSLMAIKSNQISK